jgi:DNA-binding NtrC family response regulator
MIAGATLLVVEDDPEMRLYLQEELQGAGFQVPAASSAMEALDVVRNGCVDVVITDLMMPGICGSELLAQVRSRDPDIPVVIITGFGSIESAVEAVKAGAYQYLPKPFRIDQLLDTVGSALQDRERRRRLALWRREFRTGRPRIVAESPGMQRALDLVRRAAETNAPILICGESGTGKEVLARLAHRESPRRSARFLAVNCSAIPETLLESQLFGHRRGTFTDAREDRLGLLQEAGGGTVFLDEIGDMPPALQVKLLRVLQEKEVHPLGAPAPVPVDLRVIAATHSDLEALVADGRFRQDLYYRLNVITVRIPPLRDRPEDVLPLIAHVLEKHATRLGRPGCRISGEALAALQAHSWPGNVRELENAVERGLVLCRGDVIGIDDLPEPLRRRCTRGIPSRGVRSLAEVEREHILRTLRAVGSNKAAAARILGLDRKTLYRKLKHYDIRHP